MLRLGWLAVVTLVPVVCADHASAQTSLGLLAAQNAGTVERGRRLSFVCPATDGASGTVYGTDVYTAESPVCAAAIHAGVLKAKQAGVVTLVIGSGDKAFKGSTRNGVTTKSYGAWPYSFTFATDGAPGTITWRTTWSQIPQEFTDPVAVICPPGGQLGGTVWGTEVYTRDSTICVAAVHAGVITPEKGGPVAVKRVPNSVAFRASERFGVKTAGWSAQPDAFSVAGVAAASSGTAKLAIAGPSAPSAGDVVLSIPAPSPNRTIRERVVDRVGSVVTPRNTSSVTATVHGIAVVVSWTAVPGASWYGVAGASDTMWRRVDAPATSVTYYLPFGTYTFAVGAYVEPGPDSTPAAEWPRVTATVVQPQTPQQRIEFQQSLLEFEKWKAEVEAQGTTNTAILEALQKTLEQFRQMNFAVQNLGR